MMLGVPESVSREMFTDIFVQCLFDVASHRLFDLSVHIELLQHVKQLQV